MAGAFRPAVALAGEYGAPRAEVEGDVIELLQGLADKGIVTDARGR